MRLLFLYSLLALAILPTEAIIKKYVDKGYTLLLDNRNSNVPQSTIDQMVKTYFQTYPKMCADYNPNAPKQVTIVLDPKAGGVANAGGAVETYSASYMIQNPKDTDTVTHESFHIVQSYRSSGNPGWLVEGLADYARYKYGIANAAGGWSLPAYASNQKYVDAYRVTARFLVWLEKHYGGITKQLDAAMRNGQYTAQTWNKITGSSVDQQWSKYAANPRI